MRYASVDTDLSFGPIDVFTVITMMVIFWWPLVIDQQNEKSTPSFSQNFWLKTQE